MTAIDRQLESAAQPLGRAEADLVIAALAQDVFAGGPLARLEVNLAREVFLSRVRSPKLVVDPPPYRHNQVFRGPRHLWVDFAEID